MTETSSVPSSIATVAPSRSSASTWAAACGGSVTADPSENCSWSGAAAGATSAAPTSPSPDARDGVRDRARVKEMMAVAVQAARLPNASATLQRPFAGCAGRARRLCRAAESRLDLRQDVLALGLALDDATHVAHQRFQLAVHLLRSRFMIPPPTVLRVPSVPSAPGSNGPPPRTVSRHVPAAA